MTRLIRRLPVKCLCAQLRNEGADSSHPHIVSRVLGVYRVIAARLIAKENVRLEVEKLAWAMACMLVLQEQKPVIKKAGQTRKRLERVPSRWFNLSTGRQRPLADFTKLLGFDECPVCRNSCLSDSAPNDGSGS
jgi:hypothetical protein